MNSTIYMFLMIGTISIFTIVLRFLPFLIFNGNRPVPKIVSYLGNVLPCAIMAMLVVYCLKNVSFSKASFWLPELFSVIATATLHIWKRNTLLSIIGGTACYMFFIHTII